MKSKAIHDRHLGKNFRGETFVIDISNDWMGSKKTLFLKKKEKSCPFFKLRWIVRLSYTNKKAISRDTPLIGISNIEKRSGSQRPIPIYHGWTSDDKAY